MKTPQKIIIINSKATNNSSRSLLSFTDNYNFMSVNLMCMLGWLVCWLFWSRHMGTVHVRNASRINTFCTGSLCFCVCDACASTTTNTYYYNRIVRHNHHHHRLHTHTHIDIHTLTLAAVTELLPKPVLLIFVGCVNY